MKIYNYILWSVFGIAFSASVQAYHPKVEIYEQFDNLKMVAFINPQDIEKSPVWNPNSDVPPMTLDVAIAKLRQFVAESGELGAISEIEIRPVPGYGSKWHYLVKVKNDALQSKYALYVVLMNGVVVPAIIEPPSYK